MTSSGYAVAWRGHLADETDEDLLSISTTMGQYVWQVPVQRRGSPCPPGPATAPTPRAIALAPKISPFRRKSH